VILVRVFALGGAIELQNGVDADFPDAPGDGGLVAETADVPRAGISRHDPS